MVYLPPEKNKTENSLSFLVFSLKSVRWHEARLPGALVDTLLSLFCLDWASNVSSHIALVYLTIGSYVSVRSSRYEVRGKFGEHERCVRVARGVTDGNFFSRGICLLTS